MNTSQKCNCCVKESVCKYKIEYELTLVDEAKKIIDEIFDDLKSDTMVGDASSIKKIIDD